MADEKIVIQIQDKITPSIIRKLQEISKLAISANNSILELQKNLKMFKKELIPTTVSKRLSDIKKQSLQATSGVVGLQRALSRLKSPSVVMPKIPKAPAVTPGGAGGGFAIPGALKGAVGAYLGFQGVKEIVSLSSAYTDLQNKLRIVTETEEQLATVTKKVFDIANKTRVPVEDTAKAFARFDLALKQLGASQGESLMLTETVNKMLIISGATAGEAGSSLLQLSQAFNKGKLDGDEFRSVMELMPPVADAIAKKLGVTRGELLKLAPEGKITSQIMREALASVATEIDEKFAKTVPTIGQAFNVLKNNMVEAFGVAGKESGMLEGLANAIQKLGEYLKASTPVLKTFATSLSDMLGSLVSVHSTVKTESILGTFLKRIVQGVSFIFSVISDTIKGLTVLFANFVKDRIDEIGKLIELVYSKLETWLNLLGKLGMSKVGTVASILKGGMTDKIESMSKAIETYADSVAMGETSIEKWIKNLEETEFGVSSVNAALRGTTDAAKAAGDAVASVMPKFKSLAQMTALGAASFGFIPTNQMGIDQTQALTPGIQLKQDQKQAVPMQDFILGQTSQEVMQEAFDPTLTMKEQYEKYYQDIEMLRASDIISEKKAAELKATFQKKELTTKLETASQFAGNMSSLMQSENKTAFKIGKAAALAQAGIDATLAVMAALAKPGGPAGIALAASIGVMAAVNMQKIASAQPPGFKEGGFTGYGGTSAVAGVVHGGEFVSNAATTARYRPMLERMQKGQSAVSVTIENYGTSKDFEVQQVTPDQIRIIARDEVRSQVPSLMASESMNPNSKFSKAMQNSTNLQRKRV